MIIDDNDDVRQSNLNPRNFLELIDRMKQGTHRFGNKITVILAGVAERTL